MTEVFNPVKCVKIKKVMPVHNISYMSDPTAHKTKKKDKKKIFEYFLLKSIDRIFIIKSRNYILHCIVI